MKPYEVSEELAARGWCEPGAGQLSLPELRARAEGDTEMWVELANALYRESLSEPLPILPVHFNLKGSCAGSYVRQLSTLEEHLRLNEELMFRFPSQVLDQTLPHEIAHYVCYHVYGDKVPPHGREWRSIMIEFGCRPDTYHRMPVVKAAHNRGWVYECRCGPRHLPPRQQELVYSSKGMRCRKCKQKYKPRPHSD